VGEYIMTRKIDKEKYERILMRLAEGETQKSIVIAEKCSYGTISAAKQWDLMERPTTITTTKNTSTNRTKIVVSLPNFWLECLNEDIIAGVWSDYSDAVIDIIRTYFRTRMEDIRAKSPALSKQPVGLRKDIMGELNVYQKDRHPTIRKEILGELKKNFEQAREEPSTYNELTSQERAKLRMERQEEFIKERDRVFSIFKDQKTEASNMKEYHGEPLIEKECDVLMELEQQVGEIPKWDKDTSFDSNLNPGSGKFSYVIIGNHITGLMINNKNLTSLPKTIHHLKYLHYLDLRNNKLTELPESIEKLEYLGELILDNNTLSSLPTSIGNLTNLFNLQLNNNYLTVLPETVSNLTCSIGLADNRITSIDKKILENPLYSKVLNPYYSKMDLTGNPVMDTRERNRQETTLWKIQMKEKKRERLNQKK